MRTSLAIEVAALLIRQCPRHSINAFQPVGQCVKCVASLGGQTSIDPLFCSGRSLDSICFGSSEKVGETRINIHNALCDAALCKLAGGPALDDKRIDALVAFLKTLTDKRYEGSLK